jgi:septation ring formation regulator EzrA
VSLTINHHIVTVFVRRSKSEDEAETLSETKSIVFQYTFLEKVQNVHELKWHTQSSEIYRRVNGVYTVSVLIRITLCMVLYIM